MQAYSDPKRPEKFGQSFIAQAWDGEILVSEIGDLSYDAARHVASAATLTGHTGRLMGEHQDWCEVFGPGGAYRAGTFAQTTVVRGA